MSRQSWAVAFLVVLVVVFEKKLKKPRKMKNKNLNSKKKKITTFTTIIFTALYIRGFMLVVDNYQLTTSTTSV